MKKVTGATEYKACSHHYGEKAGKLRVSLLSMLCKQEGGNRIEEKELGGMVFLFGSCVTIDSFGT